MKEKNLIKIAWNLLVLIIGSLLVGISVGLVLLPVKLTTGGFSGLATILYYLTELPAEIGLIILNIPAFIITAKVLGVKYGLKSFVGMMACSAGIMIGENIPPLTTDLMLSALFGGVI